MLAGVRDNAKQAKKSADMHLWLPGWFLSGVLQIDRADGGAGDLAAQLASSMQLGADPRAPVRV